MMKKWRFKFAEVEIFERKIVVSSLVDFKQLKKAYKDQVNKVTDETAILLAGLFEKKRLKEADINRIQHEELVDLFNIIAEIDGVQVIEQE